MVAVVEKVEYEAVRDTKIDRAWRVEGVQFYPGGEIHVALFVGADLEAENERRAREYADWMNSR